MALSPKLYTVSLGRLHRARPKLTCPSQWLVGIFAALGSVVFGCKYRHVEGRTALPVLGPACSGRSIRFVADLPPALPVDDLGIIASVLPSPNFRLTMGPRIEDTNQEGLVTSLLLLGAFFSCPLAGIIADRYGRRLCILVGALTFMLGGAMQTGAQNISESARR